MYVNKSQIDVSSLNHSNRTLNKQLGIEEEPNKRITNLWITWINLSSFLEQLMGLLSLPKLNVNVPKSLQEGK